MPSQQIDYANDDADPIQGYSPAGQLLNLISGYWVTQAIYVAAELGIADLVGKKARSVDDLAQQTQSHAPSLYRVLRALASVGIFAETAPCSFVQTPMGALLRSGMPGNLAAFSRMQGDHWHWDAWGAIVDSVRSGKSAMSLRHDKANCFDYLTTNQASAALFNTAMGSYASQVNAAVVDAYNFSDAKVIVDIGGGEGTLLSMILDGAPQARGVVLDRAEVLAGATALFQQYGVADRCRTIAGDFFHNVPESGDIYVLSSVLHDWNDDQATAILRNIGAAMMPNARLLIVEHVVPDGNESHPGKFIDLEMMLITGGKERTAREYQSLLTKAGFDIQQLIPTAVSATLIEVQRSTEYPNR